MTTKIFSLALGCALLASCGGNDANTVDAKVGDAIENTSQTNVQRTTTYNVVPASSQVLWTGSKLIGDSHTGTINISDGRLAMAGDDLVGGEFTIDMTSLESTDLDENTGKADLEGHLKSGDFFETEKYPTAEFTLVQVQPTSGTPDVTHELTGNLEMHGMTKSVTIPVNLVVTPESVTAVTPAFEIDRNDWGVKYGSGALGLAQDKIINDEVKLVINLKANRV